MSRILIVDDDPLLTRLLTQQLRQGGHSVSSFQDGAAALLAYRGRWGEVDAIISDVQMPRLDGVSLCQAIRDEGANSELRFVLMSALGTEEDILRGLEAGADDYVVKPFNPGHLLAKLEALLKTVQARPIPGTQAMLRFDQVPFQLPCQFARYRLEELLGVGGFSRVYAARRSDGVQVALKILQPEELSDRAALGRYFREVSILSELRCPHIVRVFGSGYSLGHYYIVLERIRGETAYRKLMRDGPLPPATVLRIALAASVALNALGKGGLVHRDIKPANIMLSPAGGITLIDLGLAKGVTDNALTEADELLGTTQYVAPEVIQGQPESLGSDCYSLGVTLYELITGTPPFGKDGALSILRRIASGVVVPRAATVVPHVPHELSELIADLMQPDIRRRLCDPAEAVNRFAQLAEGLALGTTRRRSSLGEVAGGDPGAARVGSGRLKTSG